MKGGSCAVLLSLLAGTASAQYDEPKPLPTWYAGGLVGYALPDPARDARNGLNLHLVGGRVLADSVSVELSLFATQFDAEASGGPDADLTGGGLDLVLGTPDYGSPVFLLGAGAVQQKIADVSKTSSFGSLGLGVYLPFSFGDELWRAEARYHVVLGEHPAMPGEDPVEDVRLNIGVLFTFGREEPVQEEESVPEEPVPAEIAPAPVAPVMADEDGDGVADGADQCPGTGAELKVDAKGCVIPADVVLRSTYFGSTSSSLTAKGYELLRQVAAAMKADPRMRFEIEGHSDMSGPAVKNLPLSQQRADAVRDFLVSLGIEPGRLVARGYGETRPVNDNKTLEKRAYNRRVQFRRLDE